MYSVIETSGFQHKVTLGEILKVPKLDQEAGSDHTYSNVLLHTNDTDSIIGTPHIEGSNVVVEVLSHGRADKIRVFKKKRRKGYRRTQGHRQDFSEVIVKEINVSDSKEVVDEKVVLRARSRAKALNALKQDQVKKTTPTPEEK